MAEQVYTDLRLLLPEGETPGTLVVRDGRIADIQPGRSAAEQDGGRQYLLPGLIELHTDTLENCALPRPGVAWPLELAVVQQDRMLLAAGITTACNALAVRDLPRSAPVADRITAMTGAVAEARRAGRLDADHRLHLRCEATCPAAVGIFEAFLHNPVLALVSLMDHRSGQRQFRTADALYRYYFGKYGLHADEVEAFLRTGLTDGEEIACHRRRIAVLARTQGLLLASHDDATAVHVAEAIADGVRISEFPTTEEAAIAAASAGLRVLMGAPNVILGGSHSGNLSAGVAARAGQLSLLSSDYAPASLLPAVFTLARAGALPLAEAVHLVTEHPAKALGLTDRGRLAVGARADLITVHDDGIVPRVTSVLVAGRRVA